MATVQIDGSTAVTATSTNNRGGSFVGGGTTTSVNMDTVRSRRGTVFGNQITAAQGDKALSSGVLGGMVKAKYVIMRYTSELATVANTTLMSGGMNLGLRRSINSNLTARAAFVSAFTITAGDGQTVSYTVVSTNTTFAADNAATPTRAVPGEFVYKVGGQIPVQKDYPARTNG